MGGILKFQDEDRLRDVAKLRWGLNQKQTEQLIKELKSRRRPSGRVNFSRRAIKRLLPWLEQGDDVEPP